MVKVAIAVLLLSTALFAATPTGTVSIGYAAGACPQGGSYQHIDTQTLDLNGNYSGTENTFAYLAAGSYCVQASYSGDATHAASIGYTTLVVNSNQIANTTTTVSANPNPMLVGSATTVVSGSVQ